MWDKWEKQRQAEQSATDANVDKAVAATDKKTAATVANTQDKIAANAKEWTANRARCVLVRVALRCSRSVSLRSFTVQRCRCSNVYILWPSPCQRVVHVLLSICNDILTGMCSLK